MLHKIKFKRPQLAIRIEHPENGCGIYQNGAKEEKNKLSQIDLDALNLHQKMRSLQEYFSWNDKFVCYFCAYLSIGDMTIYLTRKAIEGLIKEGYVILQLKIAKGFFTPDQVFYKKEDVIGQINITHLFYTPICPQALAQ